MNKVNVKIWGREFELDVIYDCLDNEEILSEQKEAAEEFLKQKNIFDDVKNNVESYITNAAENEVLTIDNIFKYVMPECIYIPRKKTREAALLCKYKFDIEHGIAVVFENEKFKEIVPQDKVL